MLTVLSLSSVIVTHEASNELDRDALIVSQYLRGSIEIGLKLEGLSLGKLAFLIIGVICAVLKIAGNVPVVNDRSIGQISDERCNSID